ncbi:MAG: ECF-type sigma factor [Acidobacteriota bacterium]
MTASSRQEITTLLLAWRSGEEEALGELMPQVYRQLSEIAGHLLRREWSNRSLETSALVHEAYLRLIDLESIDWESRAHFFAMSARIMRRVLVDQARYHQRAKRGGEAQRVETAELRVMPDDSPPDVIAVDEAINELAKHDEELARIVDLRFFGGLARHEIAEVVGLSSATVTRRWYTARAWLIRYLSAESP